MSTELSKKIIELRALGHSYNEIVSMLGCSKGTVSYYIGTDQQNKTKIRCRLYNKNNALLKKIHRFCSNHKNGQTQNSIDRTIKQILYTKIRKFGDGKFMFTTDELLNKIGDNPKCYLTGRAIDLSDSKSYHLDHIIPKSKGGQNTLDNCGIACRIANLSKSEMTYDEYISLCKEVITQHEIAHTGNAPVSQP